MPIVVQSVSVVDRQKQPILHDITATIPEESITLIVGRNGAGKSTLLDTISGLTRIEVGEVHHDGQPLWLDKKLNKRVISQIGNVFQYPEHQLFATSVEREIAYSLRYLKLSEEETASRSREAMQLMELPDHLLAEMPHLLSGGQKRRVVLASAIAANPRWLMLDEPTAGLDAQGILALREFLVERRSAGCGIVIATHDLDELLDIADHVIVIQHGRLVAELRQEELLVAGDVLRDAGLAVPTAMRFAEEMRSVEVRLPADRLLSPQELASAIEDHVGVKRNEQPEASSQMAAVAASILQETKHLAERETAHQIEHQSERLTEHTTDHKLDHPTELETVDGDPEQTSASSSDPSVRSTKRSWLETLDPRAKWLFTMLATIGILIQDSWIGLGIAGVVTIFILFIARLSWRPLMIVIGPYLFFIIVSMLISGLEIQDGVRFDVSSSLQTSYYLLKIVAAAALGVSFAFTTSHLMMKRAIEQSLRGLKRIKLPVEAIALGSSLMLRFIPVMLREYRRFGKIVRARGKDISGREGLRPRQLPPVFIPLIISLFQLASDLTTAMQARGLSGFHQHRTSSFTLRMNRNDRIVVLAGIGVLAILFTVRLVL